MNERIKELIKQANEYERKLGKGMGMSRDEKFAEFIVQDCLGVLKRRFMGDLNREDSEVKRCIKDVKKHFGVEK